MKKICVLLCCILFCPYFCFAKKCCPEREYQHAWCAAKGGKIEVKMPDGTRCDCITDTHAIEMDFGNKWAEAVGQSLNYAMNTGKKAGVVLILRKKTDKKYWQRLNAIVEYFHLPIDTWLIDRTKK